MRHLVLAAALLTFTLGGHAADTRSESGHKHAPMYMDCAKACDDCARTCDACAAHCGRMLAKGKQDHLHTLHTCSDCATVCKAAGCITARQGPFSETICTACAEVCKRCGDACEKHPADEMMTKCAAECRRCEKACREMLTHIARNSSN
ncbi:MAG: four-helix bundle copper-binding protein [Gemmataceae bacterium]